MRLAAWAVLLIVALALRLSLLTRSGWLLEGDDALSTLMAFDVLDGHFPIMLKNQTYAAAWEPYAMAVSYLVFGASRVSAKLPALLGSLACIGTSWLLARTVAGSVAGWFAAAFMALPPVYVLVLGLKPWAPYTEVILLGSLSLMCALRIGCRRSGFWALGTGIAGGLAFWMHPLAIWYLLAATFAFVLRVRALRLYGLALLGFVLGALPVWIFNVQTGGATLQFVLKGSGGQTADRWQVFLAWLNNDLPRGAGLWHPWGPSLAWLGWAVGIVLTSAAAWTVWTLARRSGRREVRESEVGNGALGVMLVFLVAIPTVLVFSGFGGPALNPYGFDATGRYAPPIWSGLVVVLGALCAALWQRRRWAAIMVACVPLAVNAVAFASIEPVEAFQSPYWDKLAVDNGPLLAALHREGVSAVWINHWAGQPLMFDARVARQPLIAYDWYDVQAGGIDRFPEYLPLVRQSDRAGFVLVTDAAEPALVARLRELGVVYEMQRVPPYVVVIPTSRRVDASEVTPELDYRY